MAFNPNDAHSLKRVCALCRLAHPAGLLTLIGDQWAPPVEATNGKRDTICACASCARAWKQYGATAVWRPFPAPERLN